jgi:hypothetical protein
MMNNLCSWTPYFNNAHSTYVFQKHQVTEYWLLLIAFPKYYKLNGIELAWQLPWKRVSVMSISWETRSTSRDWLLYVSTISRDFIKFIQARDDSQLLETVPWLSCSFRITSTKSRWIDVNVHTPSVTLGYIKKSCMTRIWHCTNYYLHKCNQSSNFNNIN